MQPYGVSSLYNNLNFSHEISNYPERNDDLFTKNLGYLDDPEPLLDPDLGHVLENSSNS